MEGLWFSKKWGCCRCHETHQSKVRSVKWTQRHQNDIKKKNMAESTLANNTRDFWSEVRKASSNHNVPVKVIDDVYGDEEISNYFGSKYEDLYSSVSYSHIEMSDVVSTINDRIEKLDMSHFTELTVENVITAVNQVKFGKKN